MIAVRALLGVALVAAVTSPSSGQPSAAVVGSVEDSLGTPIRDVQILALGTSAQASTDARGRFRLNDLRPGSYFLLIRRLGFEPIRVPVEAPTAEDSPLAIELRESATDLATVTVRADGVSPLLARTGFLERRRFSGAPAGQFLTRADLDKVRPIDLGQMLRRMSSRASRCGDGIIFLDGVLLTKPVTDPPPTAGTTTTALINSTNNNIASAAAGRAVQDATKSGTSMPKPQALDLIPPHLIEGMEVYSSPAQVPNEYRAAFREARCVILLWTR
jgi:hypothetical protein